MRFSKYTRGFVAVVFVFGAASVTSCDQGEPGPDTTLSTVVEPPAPPPSSGTGMPITGEPSPTPDAMRGTPAAPVLVVGEGDYETMCRHYCRTLEETLLYRCAGSGGQVATCRENASGTTGRCYELRCAPKLVEPSLCFTQCDSLARFYDPFCANPGPATADVCASPPAEHDRACREGCSPSSRP
jgi:hypothetical protein